MKKIYWFYCRLKAMSLIEILYRVKEKIKKEKYKNIYSDKKNVIQVKNIDISTYELNEIKNRLDNVFNKVDTIKLDFNPYIKIYDNTLNIKKKINWHSTHKEQEWDREKSCFDIDFKGKDNLGELRYTWEINRHLFFPNLAILYINNNDDLAYKTLKKHFYNWIEENPFLYGVNWMSPMEISIRSYQWLITYSIIKNKADEKFKKDILNSVINSIEYVSNNFSKYSSANNHLIIEAAIVSLIGYCVEPIYSQKWFKKGYNILNKEIPLQVYNDGVNKEQAVHYHAFVLDIMLQYNIFLKNIGQVPLHEETIYKMSEFIGYIYNNGNVVEFGDSDDAKILDLDGVKKDYYKFVLQLSSVYYKKKFIDISNLYSEVRFLVGKDFFKINDELEKFHYNKVKVYPEGGYCIINENKNFLLFDVGELGFGSICAHGHADALSIVYSKNNNPIFIDSGTYIYNVEHRWRNYFRETESHNTLYKNNKSQSKIEGPFLWSEKAKTFLIDFGEDKDLIYFKGKHNGYSPNIHERAISYLRDEEIIIIEDIFNGKGILNYTIDPRVKIEKLNDYLIKLNDIYFYSSSKIEIIDKYISKCFLIKQKTKALRIFNDFNINKKIFSIISKESIKFQDNKIILNKKIHEYIKYNDIRSDKFGNN